MAEYTRYSVDPEDIPRRRRERQKKKAKSRSRVWLVVKLFIVALLLALIAGLAVAAGAIYALSRDLPSLDNLRRNPQAVNTVIYDVHGKTIAVLHGAENRTLVGEAAIPDVMKQATVAVEDARFYEHHGVDFQGVARAILENIRAGGVVQGGSTITEQYVKNAYVGNERTYTRKIREAVLAWQLEDRWSKDKILTEYLNTVYYGAGAYGVEAASLTYFHKHVGQLNLQQAALLAAIPKFPSEYTPTTDAKMARQRRNLVLQLMATQGYITQARADRAMKTKLHVFPRPLNQNNSMADYFVSYVTSVLTKRFGTAQVFTGGLKVYTSIDMKWQQEAMDIIKSTTAPLNFGFKPSAALVAIDPANGYIRTMVGGLDYKKQKFNLASQAHRQAGSSMKPIVLATAVREGMNPDTTYYTTTSQIVIPMGAYSPPWIGQRRLGDDGPESVAAATTISDNVVFAQLSVDVGPENSVRTAHKMGVTSPLDAVPSITLGTSGVTPLEMADVYATLAANGIHHKPQAVVQVKNSRGRVIWKPTTKGDRAIPAGVASVVTQCLERVASAGTGAPSGAYFPYPRAGKTGTTENGWDVWYDGYTPQLAAAVWMGDATKNSPMSGAYGGTYCAPMWAKFFAAALKDQSHPSFKTFPWTFSPWHGKMQAMSPSASRVGVAEREHERQADGQADQDDHAEADADNDAEADADQDQRRRRRPATPTAGPKQLVALLTTPTRIQGVAAGPAAATTGTGDTGLAGSLVDWLAGVLGL